MSATKQIVIRVKFRGEWHRLHTRLPGAPFGPVFAGADYIPRPDWSAVAEAVEAGQTSGDHDGVPWELVGVLPAQEVTSV
jgi:hypothetical protein